MRKILMIELEFIDSRNKKKHDSIHISLQIAIKN